MGNCLKTQLKESVNNDNILKLGEYIIDNSRGRSGSIILRSVSGNLTVKTYQSDGTLVNTYTVTSYDTQISITSSETKISIDNKYNLRYIDSTSFIITSANLNELIYSPLRVVSFSTNQWLDNNIFEISKAKNWTEVLYLYIVNSINITGTLNDIATHPNAANIEQLIIKEAGITGSLNDITSMSGLRILNISDCPYITVTRSALNALEAQGCTVIYTQPVVEDV